MLTGMERFGSFDGTHLNYEVHGQGPTVLLLHGFASDSHINWIRPGIVDVLTDAGFGAVTLDLRGHGGSDKPHDPDRYSDGAMVRDAAELLDVLGVPDVRVVGYSMGAWVALGLALADGRVRCAVLGGIGERMLDREQADPDPVAEALEAEDKASVTHPVGRSFRDFADLTGADRHALAALRRAPRPRPAGLERVDVPVLVVCGDRDDMAGSPEGLGARIPGAETSVVPGGHLNVINNRDFHRVILEFLERDR